MAFSPDGDWVLAADLRLDDRAGLATLLGLSASAAATFSDEQLAASAFGCWGAAAPKQIRGDYAIIAWERKARRLHLVVDPFGGRALYFHQTSRRVLVASRAPTLLAVPGVPRSVEVTTLLRYYVDQREIGRLALSGIEHVSPGRHLIFDRPGHFSSRQFWTPPPAQAWLQRQGGDPVRECRELFRTAVADRLPVGEAAAGGFCSSGLDSSAVTAMAAQVLAGRGREFRSYTYVPHPDWRGQPEAPGRYANERPPVEALARMHPNLEAAFVTPDRTIFLDCLPVLFTRAAGVVRNPCNLPWFMAIHELGQAEGVTAPFCGNFGNATLSFDKHTLPDLLAVRRFDLLAREFLASPPAFLRAAATSFAPHRVRQWLGRVPTFTPAEFWHQTLALHPAVAAAHLKPPGEIHFRTARTMEGARRRFLHQRETDWLSPSEAVPPMLDPTADRRMVEFCWSLPPTEFRHRGVGRRLVRRVMAGLLPDEIRLNTRRGFQSADLWLRLGRRRDDLREAVEFLAADATCAELIDLADLRRTLVQWPATYTPEFHPAMHRFERTVTLGLYLRWFNEGLTSLPGARLPGPPIIERFKRA